MVALLPADRNDAPASGGEGVGQEELEFADLVAAGFDSAGGVVAFDVEGCVEGCEAG